MRKTDVFLIIAVVLIAILTFQKYHRQKSDQPLLSPDEQLRQQPSETLEEFREREELQQKIYTSRQNAITNAVEKVQPAVVSVNVIKTEIVRRYINPFDNPFFGFFDNVPYRREVQGIGSGVVINSEGYIITNTHVVEGATKIKIILPDSRQFDGDIIGYDTVNDIAILKINGDNIPYAKLGSSADLIIGEWSIAVGNPYGMLIKDSQPSVSVGVISAINRDFAENTEGKIYSKMIQTDAAINPGNSGGPLVNINGEVIGINTFIFSESGGSIGMGFAIPIDKVKKMSNEIIQYGKVRNIWFGFKVQDINQVMAMYLKLENTDGVIVAVVDSKGPAEQAGLHKGDIIKKINGKNIKDSDDAELAVSDVSVGDEIVLDVLRNEQSLQVIIKAIEYK
ncbi:MAG: trypsin-like peptidase domain-containing protein [Candidatus Cloacimonetes bacterium]|nr:trypsin-like peptidase domain-containing protein [Candidatus Cloacimonadota bacterium]